MLYELEFFIFIMKSLYTLIPSNGHVRYFRFRYWTRIGLYTIMFHLYFLKHHRCPRKSLYCTFNNTNSPHNRMVITSIPKAFLYTYVQPRQTKSCTEWNNALKTTLGWPNTKRQSRCHYLLDKIIMISIIPYNDILPKRRRVWIVL